MENPIEKYSLGSPEFGTELLEFARSAIDTAMPVFEEKEYFSHVAKRLVRGLETIVGGRIVSDKTFASRLCWFTEHAVFPENREHAERKTRMSQIAAELAAYQSETVSSDNMEEINYFKNIDSFQ